MKKKVSLARLQTHFFVLWVCYQARIWWSFGWLPHQQSGNPWLCCDFPDSFRKHLAERTNKEGEQRFSKSSFEVRFCLDVDVTSLVFASLFLEKEIEVYTDILCLSRQSFFAVLWNF